MLVFSAHAQQTDADGPDACHDTYLHSEMVEQNEDFMQQGFKVELFKVISFPVNTYVPVPVTLEQGQMYQINFVANRDFQKVTMVLLDKDKNELINKKFKGKDSQQHWFSQSVAAPYTGNYWIILSQKAKGEDAVCGGVSVLKAAHSSTSDTGEN